LQDQPLRSLNYTAEIVNCLDELFRSGGLQRAPPLKLKEHIQIMEIEAGGVNGSGCESEGKLDFIDTLVEGIFTRLPCESRCHVRFESIGSRSGYFSRAFSAAAFVLNGFDNGVNWPSTYLKRSHCSMILGINSYNMTVCVSSGRHFHEWQAVGARPPL
jgi:hypothetical protein